MSSMTIRNLDEEVHRRIRIAAAESGLSAEAFVRELLTETVKPKEKLGTALAAYAREHGAVELNIERDKTPARPAIFE